MQSEHTRINNHIRKAILSADAAGTKVVGLGALNKAEFLNRGGAVFVEEMPDLEVRVVHGNTLTTAVLIKTLPKGLTQVSARTKEFSQRIQSRLHSFFELSYFSFFKKNKNSTQNHKYFTSIGTKI
jgi:hypothetical protein